MHRFFGRKKPVEEGPKVTLDDAQTSLDKRSEDIDNRIKKLDAELLQYKQQMSKMRPGAAKNSVQQRAIRVLQQKKVYEKQKDQLLSQRFNIEQTKFAQESMKDTKTMVAAMKETKTHMQAAFKDMNIDEIEDLQDDMTDLLEMNDEINEAVSRSYMVPEDIDEAALDEELSALESDLLQEDDELAISTPASSTTTTTSTTTQRSLADLPLPPTSSSSSAAARQPAVPAYLAAAAATTGQQRGQVAVDEYGMPKVPARRIEA